MGQRNACFCRRLSILGYDSVQFIPGKLTPILSSWRKPAGAHTSRGSRKPCACPPPNGSPWSSFEHLRRSPRLLFWSALLSVGVVRVGPEPQPHNHTLRWGAEEGGRARSMGFRPQTSGLRSPLVLEMEWIPVGLNSKKKKKNRKRRALFQRLKTIALFSPLPKECNDVTCLQQAWAPWVYQTRQNFAIVWLGSCRTRDSWNMRERERDTYRAQKVFHVANSLFFHSLL